MSDDDIDLDRVIVDPEYRRKVIAFLNADGSYPRAGRVGEEMPAPSDGAAQAAG